MRFNYKKLSKKILKKWFSKIIHKFKKPLYHHQLVSLAWAMRENEKRPGYILDMGTGKTCVTLNLLQRFQVKKILVICPLQAFTVWKSEIPKWSNYTFTFLHGTAQERRDIALHTNYNIYIINYEGLRCIAGRKRGGKLQKDMSKIKELGFDVIVADEAHRFTNPASLQSRICEGFTRQAKRVILLTGTLLEKSASEMFGFFLVRDNGATFGKDYWYFLNHFFYRKHTWDVWRPKRICHICNKMYSDMNKHMEKHSISPLKYSLLYRDKPERTSAEIIMKTARPHILTYDRDECYDLPEQVYQRIIVEPTDEYKQTEYDLINQMPLKELSNIRTSPHIQKLMQLTSGFVYDADGKGHALNSNPKMEALQDVLEGLRGKIVIYNSYTFESKLIARHVRKSGRYFRFLNGSTPDKGMVVKQFQEIDDILIAHPRSGGESLNLQFCHQMIFFNSFAVGNRGRKQAEARIHRLGQKHACLYIDIIMNNSPDLIKYDSLKFRTNYIASLTRYLEKIRKSD